jgi:hypothetical protein
MRNKVFLYIAQQSLLCYFSFTSDAKFAQIAGWFRSQPALPAGIGANNNPTQSGKSTLFKQRKTPAEAGVENISTRPLF